MNKPRKKYKVKIPPKASAHVLAELEPADVADIEVESADEPVVVLAIPKQTWLEKLKAILSGV